MPWLWPARAIMYLVLSLPGFYTAYDSGLMPPLLGSIFCLGTAILNAVSTGEGELVGSVRTAPPRPPWTI